jgi:hypothetical protein
MMKYTVEEMHRVRIALSRNTTIQESSGVQLSGRSPLCHVEFCG